MFYLKKKRYIRVRFQDSGYFGIVFFRECHSFMMRSTFPQSNACLLQVHRSTTASYLGWAIALFGAGLVLALVQGKNGRDEGYEEI